MLYRYFLCTVIGLPLLLSVACRESGQRDYDSPEGYDLNKPYRLNLPIELDEISGIVYYPKDTSLFAINDEFGWLYKIRLNGSKQINKWKFSEAGDYEDLVIIDSIFYALRSNGDIVTFMFGDSNMVFTHDWTFPVNGHEFESLYYNNRTQMLTLICKDCEEDNKERTTVHFFNPRNNSFEETRTTIDVKKIAELAGEDDIRFKPSAAAIHPITRELYIISAVNEILVIADLNGNPKRVFPINDKLFKQPEGIAFTPRGDMIISNEAADKGVANVLLFKYHKRKV